MSIIRFCIEDWKAIFMFVYFPGYGIHLSTIDPKFLMKETLLSTYSWMEVKLMMKVNQRLPRKDFKCKDIEYKNIGQLKKSNMDYETCILKSFLENWSKRNRSCSPSVLENYNIKCKNFVSCFWFQASISLGHHQDISVIWMRLEGSPKLMMISILLWLHIACLFALRYHNWTAEICISFICRLHMNQLLWPTRKDGRKGALFVEWELSQFCK